MSAWHELSEKSQRVARRRFFPGWFFNGLAWVFRRMGSASPRPTAKEYLAPMRMSVSAGPICHVILDRSQLCASLVRRSKFIDGKKRH